MAKEKPFYKKKRFWGTVIAALGVILKIFVPQSAPIIDSLQPILQPVLDNMDLISDTVIVGGAALGGYGVIDANNRKKKEKE
jgi:hypothetical protein